MSLPSASLCCADNDLVGCNFINGNLSWQLPVVFQGVACVFVLGLVWFIPESPRFLMAQGREEEARAFLVKYHGNNNPDSVLVALEMQEMKTGIALDGIDKVWWDCQCFITGRSQMRI